MSSIQTQPNLSGLQSLPLPILECIEEACLTAFESGEGALDVLREFSDIVSIHLRKAEIKETMVVDSEESCCPMAGPRKSTAKRKPRPRVDDSAIDAPSLGA